MHSRSAFKDVEMFRKLIALYMKIVLMIITVAQTCSIVLIAVDYIITVIGYEPADLTVHPPKTIEGGLIFFV